MKIGSILCFREKNLLPTHEMLPKLISKMLSISSSKIKEKKEKTQTKNLYFLLHFEFYKDKKSIFLLYFEKKWKKYENFKIKE